MEIPIDLSKANTFLDAAQSLDILYSSRKKAKNAVDKLGRSGRLVSTTAYKECSERSRGGSIILNSPQSLEEARRWIRHRGFGEIIDGFQHTIDSIYLVKRDLSLCAGPSIDIATDKSSRLKRV